MATSKKISPKKLRGIVQQREEKRGLLLVFEGPDGSGKTTQRKLLKDWLKTEEYDLVSTKWASSDLIKPLVAARKETHAFSPEEYCLLHAADFRQRLEMDILPALWAGKIVICDRYLYTGLSRDVARGLALDWILNAYYPMIWPDVVFYFQVSAETSGQRIAAERAPKFYESGQDVTNIEDPYESYQQFTKRVIQEYEALAVMFDFQKVNGELPIYKQHKQIRELFTQATRKPWSEWNMEALLDWLERKWDQPEVQLALQA